MSSIARQCTTLLRAPSLKTAIFELYWAVLVHDFIIFVQLPGFEEIGGAYRLHPPCSRYALTWLRQTTDRWAKQGKLEKHQGEVIPDPRQPRGWDFATRIYRSDNEQTKETEEV